jgi:hypothetical protein
MFEKPGENCFECKKNDEKKMDRFFGKLILIFREKVDENPAKFSFFCQKIDFFEQKLTWEKQIFYLRN